MVHFRRKQRIHKDYHLRHQITLSPIPIRRDPKPSLSSTCDYGSASYWDRRYLSYPPRLAFEWSCNYNSLMPILAAHFYLTANNKAETPPIKTAKAIVTTTREEMAEDDQWEGGGGLLGWGI